ncbi:MAG TPA: hypothetical protein VK327_10560 [Candidatus Paceibacterota bacterium]|nr:hypothetical protein [Candidatus Paceibacterota bacterium]
MKAKSILALTLGLNLALAILWLWLRAAERHGETPSTARPPISTASIASAPVTVTTNLVNMAFHWRQIESDDYHRYIANLHEIGCPERLVREIVIKDLQRLYNKKRSELPVANFPPWTSRQQRNAVRQSRLQQLKASNEELHEVIHELLGIDWDEEIEEMLKDNGKIDVFLDFIPKEKCGQILTLFNASTKAGWEVLRRTQNILLEEDFAELRQIRDSMLAQLKQTLTPEQLDEFCLRVQADEFIVRGEVHLQGTGVSGAELREIARLSKLWCDVLTEKVVTIVTTEPVSPGEEAKRKEKFEQQLAQLLGTVRFNDYRLAQNEDYRNAFAFTATNQLPKSAAVRVYESLSHARKEADAIRGDNSFSEQERATALEVLRTATLNSITSALGSKAAGYLEKHDSELGNLWQAENPESEEAP